MSLTVSTCLHRCFDDAFERNGNNCTTIISVINVNNNIFINNSNITSSITTTVIIIKIWNTTVKSIVIDSINALVDNKIFTVKNNTKTFAVRDVGELWLIAHSLLSVLTASCLFQEEGERGERSHSLRRISVLFLY